MYIYCYYSDRNCTYVCPQMSVEANTHVWGICIYISAAEYIKTE